MQMNRLRMIIKIVETAAAVAVMRGVTAPCLTMTGQERRKSNVKRKERNHREDGNKVRGS